MIKETIFNNMEDINTLPTSNPEQEIEITPQEVLDFFTNNTEEDKKAQKEQQTIKGKTRIVNEDGDVELTIPREAWKNAGLDEELQQVQDSATNPASSAPIPEIFDPTVENKYTNELLHSSVTKQTQDRMLYDLSKVTITDDEKEYYLRTVLDGNEPLDLYVTVGNRRKIGFQCISKTIEVQNLIGKLADIYINEKDPNDKTQYLHTTFEGGMYLLKLNAMFCLKGEGDEDGVKKPALFKEIPLDIPFSEQQAIVEENIQIINKLSFAKWNAMLNILRIFEQKEVLLGAELISGDF